MRFNSAEAPGTRLFADEKKPVASVKTPGLDVFLERLQRGYRCTFLIGDGGSNEAKIFTLTAIPITEKGNHA
jgi:hypothetical protein